MPVVSSTPSVTVRASDLTYACTDSAAAIEDYLSYLSTQFSVYRVVEVPHVEVLVHDLESELPASCSGASACVVDGRIIHSVRTAWHPHEMVHVVAQALGRAPALIEEGLAIYVEPSDALGEPVDRALPIEDYFESNAWRSLWNSDRVSGSNTARSAAGFTRFLVHAIGLSGYLAIYESLSYELSLDGISEEVLRRTGTSLGDWLAMWRASSDLADSTLLGFETAYGCTQPDLASVTSVSMSCAVQPLSMIGNSVGAYSSLRLAAPSQVSVAFPPSYSVSALSIDGCESSDVVRSSFGLDTVSTTYLQALDTGAYSLVTEGYSTFGASENVSVSTNALDPADGCKAPTLSIDAPARIVLLSPAFLSEHPVLGPSATFALDVTTSLTLDVSAADGVEAWVCQGQCADAASCEAASSAFSGGPIDIAAGAKLFFVLASSSTPSSSLVLRFR